MLCQMCQQATKGETMIYQRSLKDEVNEREKLGRGR
jgi:hypothetical protein